jgi:hypothetical protein
MKKYYLLLLLLSPILVMAQGNYQPGFIVTLKGDTLKGLIDYRQWDKNPKNINFKNSKAAQVEVYNTDNAKEFILSQFACDYQKYTVGISYDGVGNSRLSANTDTATVTSTVFLRLLLKGKNLSLYSYTDVVKTRYFIAQDNLTPVELSHHNYMDENGKLITQNNYRSQLQDAVNRYSPDNKTLVSQAKLATYTNGDIRRVVNGINKVGIAAKTRALNTNASLFAGISLNENVTTIESNNGSNVSQNSTFIFPELHFGANIALDKLKNISFRIEALATYSVGTYDIKNNDGIYSSFGQTKIKDFTIGVNPQAIYTFDSNSPGKFYAGLGVSLNAVQSTYSSVSYNSYMGGPSTLGGTETDNTSFITVGGTLKAGYVINKKFDVYLGYDVRITEVENVVIIGYKTPTKVTGLSVYKLGINYSLGKSKR